MHFASRIVTLQRDGTAGQSRWGTVWFGVVHRLPAIHRDYDVPATNDGVHREPLVVLLAFADVLYGVQAPGAPPVGVRVVDLHLVAIRRPIRRLIGRADVDTRVRARSSHDIELELEVLEFMILHGAIVKKMRARSVDDDLAIRHAE